MKGDGSGIGGRGLLIASVVFILIVGAIFFAITDGLFGNSQKTGTDTQAAVTDLFVSRSARMTVQGPIVANENRESYVVEVSMDTRTIQALKGYDQTVIDTHGYSNNRVAYTDFVYALSRVGFGKARTVSQSAADERGVCATGTHYVFEILDNGRSLSRLWTTSCSKEKGTLDVSSSNLKSIKSLFDVQIPDRQTVLKDIKLR